MQGSTASSVVAPADASAGDRVAGFDLLRGLCALAVACYHALDWSGAPTPHNLGTYPVYIFFALSGASMTLAYAPRFAAGFPVQRFLALRFARLAPLYLLGLVLAIARMLGEGSYGLVQAGYSLLNLGFVFGLGNPGATAQVTGGWSLGIEFVFYLLFPVLLALVGGRWWLWFVAACFVAQHLFIALVFANGATLAQNWSSYTQFLAFVFYFAAGCAIGRALREGRLPAPGWAGFAACLVAIGASSGASTEAGLTGLTGLLLSLAATMAVAAAATLRLRGIVGNVSALLGRASYGIYILHPGVFASLAALDMGGSSLALALLTAALSLPLALAVEWLFERPAQRRVKGWLAGSGRP